MSRTPRIVLAVALAGGLLLAGGCADPQPTIMANPTIIWENNNPPSSPLEDNKWVKAIRGYSLGIAMAWNSGDFTIKQLTDYVTYDDLVLFADGYADRGDQPWVYLGPGMFQPVDVYELPGGSGAAITICIFSDGPDLEKPDYFVNGWVEPAVKDRKADISISYVMKDETTGELQPASNDVRLQFPKEVRARDSEPCDAASIPVGRFNPTPKLPPTPVTKPVRNPLPEN